MSISEDINMITSNSPAPPNMPPNLRDTREMLHWASVTFLVMAAILGLYGLLNLLFVMLGSFYNLIFGVFYIAMAGLSFYAAVEVKRVVIPTLDFGDVEKAKNESVKWILVGLITGFIQAIFMIIAYVKMSEHLNPAPPQGYYQQPPGYAAQGQAQYQQAPQPQQGYHPQAGQYPHQSAPVPPQYQAPPPPGQYQQAAPQGYAAPQPTPVQEPASAPTEQTPPITPPSKQYVPQQPEEPPEIPQGSSAVPVQVTRCPSCGMEIPPGASTCPNCGANL